MRYTIKNLNCAHCASKIEAELKDISGLEGASLNFSTRRLTVPPGFDVIIQEVLDRIEPGATLASEGESGVIEHEKKVWIEWLPAILSLVLLVGGLLVAPYLRAHGVTWPAQLAFLISFALVGWRVLYRAGEKLIRGQMLDEHFLMSVASLGAIAIGELPEAAAVMVFYAIGERFQAMAVGKSRRSIKALLSLSPDTAHVLRDGTEVALHPDAVQIGELFIVRPGERMPLDGEIIEGSSFVDTSALTGESVPRRVEPGSTLMAGSINQQGVLKVRSTKLYADTAVVRILELVEKAGEKKSPAEQFITSFARYYTPGVVGLAIVLALIPPLIIPGATFAEWIYRALVLLVISCPCALVVSVPLTYFAGIGAASRQGVLFKGANFIDSLAQAEAVVFDKTGTITQGTFQVTSVIPAEGTAPTGLLSLAAALEQHSLHPIAHSINAAATGEPLPEVSEVEEMAGKGLRGVVGGQLALAGNSRLLEEHGVAAVDHTGAGAVVHVALGGEYLGHIVLADEIRSDARQTVTALRDMGLSNVIMLSGDKEANARAIAEELGFDAYHAQLLPEDKVMHLERIGSTHRTIFVGDGINDAPVIARADVGVAMGGIGSDAAIEAADVVLVDPQPSKLISAIQIARRTRNIARQNIALSLGVKALFLSLGALGLTSVWGAVFADVGVALLAVLNALRALTRVKS